MTRRRTFQRLVRARMDKTGESYTAARTRLLAAVVAGLAARADIDGWIGWCSSV